MRQMKFVGLVACFAAGALLAGLLAVSGIAADTTTTEAPTETTTIVESTTAPPTTVVTTLEHTTTQRVIVHPATTAGTTTTASGSTGSTPAWVWALVGVLAVALVIVIVLLARRGGGGISSQERRRRLDMAVGTWAAQGWALESQSADSAVLQRAGERMVVTVASSGQVGTHLLS